jgi:hypothetical protein
VKVYCTDIRQFDASILASFLLGTTFPSLEIYSFPLLRKIFKNYFHSCTFFSLYLILIKFTLLFVMTQPYSIQSLNYFDYIYHA